MRRYQDYLYCFLFRIVLKDISLFMKPLIPYFRSALGFKTNVDPIACLLLASARWIPQPYCYFLLYVPNVFCTLISSIDLREPSWKLKLSFFSVDWCLKLLRFVFKFSVKFYSFLLGKHHQPHGNRGSVRSYDTRTQTTVISQRDRYGRFVGGGVDFPRNYWGR